MSLETSVRLSLLARMVVALAVISAVSITIGLVAVVATGTAVVVAVAAAVALVELFALSVVDGISIGHVLSPSVPTVVSAVLVIGVASLPALYLRPVSAEIRAFRRELGDTGQPATERHPEVATTVRRLSHQAGIPEPTVRIINRRRPESYALGGQSAGTIVITRGVIRHCTDDELEAVLAHEVSHLVNGDGRIMSLLLVPMLVAERVGAGDRPRFRLTHGLGVFSYGVRLACWALVTAVTTIQLVLCRLGVALLSRGREVAADRGAAELAGSPSALASALETLSDARGRPTQDLRHVTRSAGALDILPPEDQQRLSAPFRTHPATETRVEYLTSMVTDGNA